MPLPIGIHHPELVKARTTRVVEPDDCPHLGQVIRGPERQVLGLRHEKAWSRCNHPDQPLGSAVCKCNGCGPGCPGYPKQDEVVWSYGVTTVPSRRSTYLPRTLRSLLEGGFDKPRLFVDGDRDGHLWGEQFKLEVTSRYPAVMTHANWVLSAYELYLRDPQATRYALFQDDFVTSRNLRRYLESAPYPADGYLNLYTFPSNQGLCPPGHRGWYRSNQLGRGAVALVFSRSALQTLLSSPHMVRRAANMSPNHAGRPRGQISVDGGIVTAMREAGLFEYVSARSLVQHTGGESSMGNGRHPEATSFPGEEFDLMDLLK